LSIYFVAFQIANCRHCLTDSSSSQRNLNLFMEQV